MDATLTEFGLTRSKYDSCLYFKEADGEKIYVSVFVDDLLIAGTSNKIISDFKSQIAARFSMKDMGPVTSILGMEVQRDQEGSIKLSQSKYTEEVLKRFGFNNCKPCSTPLEANLQLWADGGAEKKEGPRGATSEGGSESERAGLERYREIVGSLMYLSVSTRPDISYAVGYLARFLNKPDVTHLKAAHHVLRYLRGTSTMGIRYHEGGDLLLKGSGWWTSVMEVYLTADRGALIY